MKSIEMPPYAPTLMESTRAIGYSLEAAAADIIDNSIAAGASQVDIMYSPSDLSIAILDDGCGMDADQLNAAMKYGSRDPAESRTAQDLGRFGLGLKTASLSQCRVLTVASKREDLLEVRRWDLDHVRKTGKWALQILNTRKDRQDIPHIDALMKQKSGTLVIWQNLDRMMLGESDPSKVLGRKMDGVREHISLVFHRYLAPDAKGSHQKLRIFMNREAVEPVDPFLAAKSDRPMADETLVLNGQSVVVRPFILPHISKMTDAELRSLGGPDGLRQRQGFYIYRNRRLIIWGTWFRARPKDELSKLLRVQVDIPNTLDDLWTLNIKKSEAMPPADVRSNLAAVIEKMAVQSKRTLTYRGKKAPTDTPAAMWDRLEGRDGAIAYRINRNHPAVSKLLAKCRKNSAEALLTLIESALPIQQLMADLAGERSIVKNDSAEVKDEVDAALKAILEIMNSAEERREMLDRLKYTEPFMQWPEIFYKYRIEGEHDHE